MGRESRYEIQTYLLHDIRVRAQRPERDAPWTVRVDVRRPNGEHCRRIESDGTAWPQVEQAMVDGFRIGRALVDDRAC